MKKLFVLVSIAGFGLASDFIPRDRIENLSNNFVHQKFGSSYSLSEVLTYYGIDELPNAYAIVYSNKDNRPLTIIMGARSTTSPISEIYHALPSIKSDYGRILQKAGELLESPPEFNKIYYFGSGDEYFSFKANNREILINAHTLKTIDKALIRLVPNKELEELTRKKWEKYFVLNDFSTRQSGYVDSVPFIDWVYGCSPTAASMLFWYWDARGYGKLVDHFFTHWDEPENEWNECANTNRELALAMFTDTLTGGTTIGNIRPGMLTVANTTNGYAFTGATSPQGNTTNQFVFSWIKTEIDNQRPFHWNVLNYWYAPFSDYINHSVTGVGYDIILPDTFVIVHNTWDTNEPLWPLWTYYSGVWSFDWVVTFVPGGSNPNNAFIDYPLGGDVYSLATVFKNIKYYIRWHSVGANIDHLKSWYSTSVNGQSYDSLYWTVIGDDIANTGKYVWTCPNIDCSLRVNISAMNLSNVRLCADGSFGRSMTKELNHSPEINLVGHYDTPGWTNDVVVVGNYAYIADGTNGLMVIDVSDSSLPDYAGNLLLPGNSVSLAAAGQYLYVGDREDTLRVVSISDPVNPVAVGKCSFTDDVLDIFVVDTLAFVAARSQGLVIVNVVNPANPNIIGIFNTSGFSQDVFVDANYAYVADATRGVRTINIVDPTNPVETGYYDTNGVTYGVSKSGNLVYAADGTQGMKIFDGSSPDTLILLGSLDTPTIATKSMYWNNYLFVADGNQGGIRAIDVANPSIPVEAGYIQSFGSSCNLLVSGSMVYLADGSIGLLLITQNLVGVAENRMTAPQGTINILPIPARVNGSITISLGLENRLEAKIELFDCSGRHLETIYKKVLNSGNYQIRWQPKNIPAGVYFVEIELGNSRNIQKLVLVK